MEEFLTGKDLSVGIIGNPTNSYMVLPIIEEDYSVLPEGNPKLLEVNPNPGWCWDGHLAKMAKIDGISYTKMLKMILQAGEQRLGLLEKAEFDKS